MSEVKVNKISPRSGTTITLGDSGDTFTVPSGVTFDASSGGLAGTLTTAAQPNITSVGTLTSFTSTGIDDNATSTAITIDSSGDVGINNTAPNLTPFNKAVTLSGTNNCAYELAKGSTLHGAFALQGDNRVQLINFQDADITFATGTSATERMRIDHSTGRIGINTSSPDDTLHVKGNVFIEDSSPEITFETTNSSKSNWQIAVQENIDQALEISYGSQDADASNDTFTPIAVFKTDRVGINTSNPSSISNLHVADAYANEPMIRIETSDSGNKRLDLYVSGGHGYVTARQSAQNLNLDARSNLIFNSGSSEGTERMRITSSGVFLFGKTSAGTGVNGVEFENNGKAVFSRSGTTGGTPMFINRNDSDGNIVSIRQADSEEGTISVSGSTVSYNSFTGSHWSRFTDNSKPTILKGTVLESLDEMCDWYNLEFDVITQDEDGNDITSPQKIPHVLADGQSVGDTVTYNHQGTDYQATIVKEDDIKHMKSKVSDTLDAKNVYGVFLAYDEDGEGYNDFYVASVGSFVVRIKANETIAKGDLLQSNGDGTAKVQTDDAVRSSSFAKVLSTTIIETYDDGSFIVPCSLMC